MSCTHELVLNGACYYCGSTDLDPTALSPKTDDSSFVPSDRLRRRTDPEPASVDSREQAAADTDAISDT